MNYKIDYLKKIVSGEISFDEITFRIRQLSSNSRILHIEFTSKCNLACKACFRSGIMAEYLELGIDMRLSTLLTIIDKYSIYDVMGIIISGSGEALLHPHFFDYIRRLKNKFKYAKIKMFTNGLILSNNREMLVRICDADIDTLHFSLHGARQETVSVLQKGLDVSKVLEAIQFIKTNSNIKLGINFVVQTENVDEMVELLELLNKTGTVLDFLSFNLMNYTCQTDKELDYSKLWDEMGIKEKFLRVYERADELGIPVIRAGKITCSILEFDTITAKGEMLPCTAKFLVKKYSMGNILNESKKDVHGRTKLTKICKEIKNNHNCDIIPEICIGCYGNGKYNTYFGDK